jgi:type IV pilus assembly protein PilM
MSVGIDIGSKTVKVVELVSERDKKFSLRTAGIVGHTYGSIENMKEDKEYANISGVIKKLLRESKVSSRDVSVSLPESQVFTRIVRFPLLSDQEISSAIRWEAEEYIPIPARDAVIQHQIIERREDSNPPEVVVLLVAAPRAMVEKYVRVASIAGLSVVGVETGLMSAVRSLAPVSQTVLIADFGARSTDIAISRGAQLFLSRSIPTAGDAFTRAVAQSLGVPEKQAEEYKRVYGLSNEQLEGRVSSSLSPIFRIVAEEIKKTMHYYQSGEGGDIPTSLILSGGTAGLPGVVPALSKSLEIEVSIGNPFLKVYVEPTLLASLESYAPLYSVAVGLALRGE